MSYSRWSNSDWYSFANINGRLSLWLAGGGKTLDWTYEECQLLEVAVIMDIYGCSRDNAEEAMKYVGYYLSEFTAEECNAPMEIHDKELNAFKAKLNETEKKDE